MGGAGNDGGDSGDDDSEGSPAPLSEISSHISSMRLSRAPSSSSSGARRSSAGDEEGRGPVGSIGLEERRSACDVLGIILDSVSSARHTIDSTLTLERIDSGE